jgi:S1-C subfamily serine protease
MTRFHNPRIRTGFWVASFTVLLASCNRHTPPAAPANIPPLNIPSAAEPVVKKANVLLPAVKSHLFGFIDESGAFKISPQFTAARGFKEGRAAVRIGGSEVDYRAPRGTGISDKAGRIGFIDESGHFVINPTYFCARDFSKSGVALVAKSKAVDSAGKSYCTDWQGVDLRGKELFAKPFSAVGQFNEGLLNVATVEHVQVSQEKETEDCTSDNARRHGHCLPGKRVEAAWIDLKKYGAVDLNGNWKIPPRYQMMTPFHDGVAFVMKDCTAALIDVSGTELTPYRFNGCKLLPSGFFEGLSVAASADGTREQVGYIDKTGQFAIAQQFDKGLSFHEGLAAVDEGGLWGYINATGSLVINPAFKIATHFEHGMAYVCTSDGAVAVVDTHGDTKRKTSLACDTPDKSDENIGPIFPVSVNGFFVGQDSKTGSQVWLTEDGRELYREALQSDDATATTSVKQEGKTEIQTTGTAFVVSSAGFLITNAHVIAGCRKVTIPATNTTAEVVKVDKANDLALLKVTFPIVESPSIAKGDSIVLGLDVVIFGYPLPGVISSSGNLATGVVSGLTGLADDSRFFQFSAPIQPGNSGGPALNRMGQIIGVVSATLNPQAEYAAVGNLPQNVNFAIGPNMLRQFLASQNVPFRESSQWISWKKDIDSLAAYATTFTYQVVCSAASSGEGQ